MDSAEHPKCCETGVQDSDHSTCIDHIAAMVVTRNQVDVSFVASFDIAVLDIFDVSRSVVQMHGGGLCGGLVGARSTWT